MNGKVAEMIKLETKIYNTSKVTGVFKTNLFLSVVTKVQQAKQSTAIIIFVYVSKKIIRHQSMHQICSLKLTLPTELYTRHFPR